MGLNHATGVPQHPGCALRDRGWLIKTDRMCLEVRAPPQQKGGAPPGRLKVALNQHLSKLM